MQNPFFRAKKSGWPIALLVLLFLVLLPACDDTNTDPYSRTTADQVGTGSADPPPDPHPTLTLTLTDITTNAPVASISATTPAKVTATLKDEAGLPIAKSVVTFTINPALAVMDPPSGTALTDSSGVAAITLAGTTSTGAATLTGTTQVGTASVSGTLGFAVATGHPVTVTLEGPFFGVNTAPFAPAPLSTFGTTPGTLSAFGTTSIGVALKVDGVLASTAQTVNFSSVCATAGSAVLDPSAVTVGGVATVSYRDNGCAGPDLITAAVSGNLASVSANLTVLAPTTGSIQFVSSTPTNISLKGIGGTEVSQVTFKVLDVGGNPVQGKTVNFGLSTNAGGIILTPNTGVAPFDAGTGVTDSHGLVVTNVTTGTVSTPVRVIATTLGAGNVSLTTQSNQLTISTGIPDEYGFSLSATPHNIEGWDYDGVTSVVRVGMADHYKNPIPDGTPVSFTAEGGLISSECRTKDGICSATVSSQNGRLGNGRITVLAYAVGEQTFTDFNGNGWADRSPANELIAPNGTPTTNSGEAFVDYNENGVRDPNEPFIDFNNNGSYDSPSADGKYLGALCDDDTPGRSAAGTCARDQNNKIIHTYHVRESDVIVYSGSHAQITIYGDSGPDTPLALPRCVPGNITPKSFMVKVVDLHGNAMPAGTTVDFTTTNGKITSSNFIVPDTIGSTDLSLPLGSATFGNIEVIANTDASPKTCEDPTGTNGIFTVTVTTPKGIISTKTATLTD